jgi:hypothetical protein
VRHDDNVVDHVTEHDDPCALSHERSAPSTRWRSRPRAARCCVRGRG